MARLSLIAAFLLGLPSAVVAKDSLGVFGDWGAFRDAEIPRCYAIAAANQTRSSRETDPFASVGTWPAEQVRGQVHFRLSRQMREGSSIRLVLGSERFELQGSGGDAWADDPRMDASIVAAIRAAGSMSISATDRQGRRFTDRYNLSGAATAMDAATVGCARNRQ